MKKPKQLVMTFGTWGGWRPGAGRKPSKRRNKRALHRKRPRMSRRCPAHVTLKVHRDVTSLRNKARCKVIRSAFVAACNYPAVFTERYHLRLLETPREIRNARAYVINNYRRHAAVTGRRVDRDWVDPCSSWAWFDGWRDLTRAHVALARETRAGPKPVSEAAFFHRAASSGQPTRTSPSALPRVTSTLTSRASVSFAGVISKHSAVSSSKPSTSASAPAW